MKILLIAPKHRDINQIPEIRQLTSLHRTTVLNGDLSVQNIFDEVRKQDYDVVHFATDLMSEKNDEMYINERETLGLSDTDNILKLAKATLVFFNFCSSSRFATYVTNRGIECAIYTTVPIEDRLSWRFPIAFYEQIKREENQKGFSLTAIYESIAPSDGSYGLVAGIKYYQGYFKQLNDLLYELHSKIDELSELVSHHSVILGTNDFMKLNNKMLLWIVVAIAGLIVLSSSMIIYSNINTLFGG